MQILHINFITNNLLFKMNEHILFQTKKHVQQNTVMSYVELAKNSSTSTTRQIT